MKNVYTVRQLTAYIKNMFDQDFLLSGVTVKGEISNLKDHPSGHIYMTLKDDKSSIMVVMFAGKRRGLKCRLQEGRSVRVTGAVSVYEAAGRYQLYAEEIADDGEGDLYRQFLELKERLQEMGMFDAAYKKPIPAYARTVGIVTASSGAALHDIVQIARRRNPYVQLILSPALVQGEAAPESIVRAVERLDRLHPDVMIVGRGGGSIEDLWCFNDERVARAVFDADTPVISAVGHEVDFTICDFAADLRAATPSAAAELAVFRANDLLMNLSDLQSRARLLASDKVHQLRNRLSVLDGRLKALQPERRLETKKAELLRLKTRLDARMDALLFTYGKSLAVYAERLKGLSPTEKLKNGFGYISVDGKPLLGVGDISEGDELKVTLHDGSVRTGVLEILPKA